MKKDAQEIMIEINRRLALKRLEPLDAEAAALLTAGTDEAEIAAMFDDMRDRCGVDCDDLRGSLQ